MKEESLCLPVTVELGMRSYLVHVGRGLLKNTGILIKERFPDANRCVVITSEAILGIHGEVLLDALHMADIEASVAQVPDGEEAKSWQCVESLIGELLENRLDRKSVVVAFGGGAVGDVSGFVSSIFMRGIDLVQVPTTLLAQVDSSLGGKAAVNHPLGKNLVGTFHQPSLVVSDPELLTTLPKKEILSGLVEVVKHGVIADRDLFEYVEERSRELMDANPDALTHVVRKSVVIKAKLIALDERDTEGLRAILNYGHTLGHALETLTDHRLRHGEAVALGMETAAIISEKLSLITRGEVERQTCLLEALGLNLESPAVDIGRVVEVMRRDKKTEKGVIRFVLPTGIGSDPVLREVPEDLIRQTLEEKSYG
jgi:3-dehydroquinate synthase